jgi:hypothetical protein
MTKCVLAMTICLAAGALSFAKTEETTQQLIVRAEAAPPDKQSDLFLEVAEREVKDAVAAFQAYKNADGLTTLEAVVKHCDQAHVSSIRSNKRQKHTEIKLRQIAGRLRDAKMNVDVDSQARVQAAVDQIEQFRTELLKSMFGGEKP